MSSFFSFDAWDWRWLNAFMFLQDVPGRSASGGADHGIPWSALIMLNLIVLVVIAFVYSSYRNGQPFRIEGVTTASPGAATDAITERYVRAGWSAATLSDGRVLFSRTTKPNTGTTIILALFFVLPALIYIVTSQKHQTAELRAVVGTARGTEIEILGNTTGYGGVRTAAEILRQLPKR